MRWEERVEAIVSRDGPKCVWCGKEVWDEDLSLDHLCPNSRGGKANLDNLLLSCKNCNHRRKSKSAVSYLRQVAKEGHRPQVKIVRQGLDRLAGSNDRKLAAYGQKQLRHLGD